MAANEISLGFPDSQNVTVFVDGKHVATMTNAPGYEDGIPMELFNLMRAAPELLDVLRLKAEADPSSGERACNCDDYDRGFKCDNCLIWAAIDKAEGKVG